ncbi:hypothetical protein AMECASPLE_012546 [Ameca splendens]|uniref:Uncharacterized protein n=1 Tax=Ameca splendens TaxID=208324 RepID=A0ABV0YCW9_9TELE
MLHHCFLSCWKLGLGYHATEARIILEKKLTRGFSFIVLTGQTHEKLNELKAYWDKKTSRFTLLIKGMDLTRNSRKTHGGFMTKLSFLVLLQSTADDPSYFSPFAKEGEVDLPFRLLLTHKNFFPSSLYSLLQRRQHQLISFLFYFC